MVSRLYQGLVRAVSGARLAPICFCGVAELLPTLGYSGDRARQLAYVLYQKANDRGWATEAGAYNGLITAWDTLQSTVDATAAAATEPSQQSLL